MLYSGTFLRQNYTICSIYMLSSTLLAFLKPKHYRVYIYIYTYIHVYNAFHKALCYLLKFKCSSLYTASVGRLNFILYPFVSF